MPELCQARHPRFGGHPRRVPCSGKSGGKKATVEVPESVADETLKAAVTEAGYEVTGITTHEG